MKSRLGTIILLLAFVAATGCGKQSDEQGHDEDHHDEHAIGSVDLSQQIQRTVGLTSEKVERAKFYSLLEVYGSIAQDTENTVHITSGTSGTLRSILGGEGQTVEKGKVVATIEVNDGVHEIHSPIHGVVLARYAKEGDRIDAVTSLLTIANPDVLRASFDVYEKDIGKVAVGQEAAIKSAAYKDRCGCPEQRRSSSKIRYVCHRSNQRRIRGRNIDCPCRRRSND
jgi:biotin carboxyl carrier protein